MKSDLKSAAKLHSNVPPNWYYQSIKQNIGQKFWHNSRFREVGNMIEVVDGKVLDIGCADGVFSKVILDKSHAKEIIGIDVLENSVKWAKKHWQRNKKLKFRLGNAHDLKFKANTFSAVFALEVMEHLPKPQKMIDEVKRVLKKDGYAIFLVPSDNSLFRAIWYIWTHYGRGKIWNDCHIQSFSKNNKLSELVKSRGLAIDVDKTFLFGMLNVVKARKI